MVSVLIGVQFARRITANLRSVIATARKQRWNVLETLAHPDPMQLIPQLRF